MFVIVWVKFRNYKFQNILRHATENMMPDTQQHAPEQFPIFIKKL